MTLLFLVVRLSVLFKLTESQSPHLLKGEHNIMPYRVVVNIKQHVSSGPHWRRYVNTTAFPKNLWIGP